MGDSARHRRRIYLTCRPIFSGVNAQVRKQRKIKELVNKSKKSLQPLLRDIGEAKVIEILKSLLEKRIFESELRAKVEFPDLFRPSPFRNSQRQASEVDAARSTAAALDDIISQDGEGFSREEMIPEEPEEAAEAVAVVVEDDGPLFATGSSS